MIILSHPASAEGRIAIVTDVRKRDAVDVRELSALVAPTKAFSRTAKSCGPDTPTLVSSLQDGDVGPIGPDTPRTGRRWRLSSPALQGEREAAVKTIAQGMPDCSGLACGDCRLLFLLQAGHGCGLHPAFPAPSHFPEGHADASPGRVRAAGRRRRASSQ
jgi:hypothetical protein